MIIEVKNTLTWTYDINDLNGERWWMVNGDLNLNKLLEYFKKKNYEKQINNDLE